MIPLARPLQGSERLRQSVPTSELERYYFCGWAYVLPDFDKPNHSIVEWLSEKIPVYPANRVPPTQTKSTHEQNTSPPDYVAPAPHEAG